MTDLHQRAEQAERELNEQAIANGPGPTTEQWFYFADLIAELRRENEDARSDVARLHKSKMGLFDANISLRWENEGLRADAERYRWLANRVLACDYGDNDAAGQQIGWRIRHDLFPRSPLQVMTNTGDRGPAFMYGASIDTAIDAARNTPTGEQT